MRCSDLAQVRFWRSHMLISRFAGISINRQLRVGLRQPFPAWFLHCPDPRGSFTMKSAELAE
jgi:hypothetical protein